MSETASYDVATRGSLAHAAGRCAARVVSCGSPSVLGGQPPRLAAEPTPGELAAPGSRLALAVDEMAAIDVDALSDAELRQHLADLRQPLARLTALRASWSASLESRDIAAAPPQQRGSAQREGRLAFADEHQLTPSEAKRAVEAGKAAHQHPETRQAFLAGDLSPEHVQVIDEVLRAVDTEHRDLLEQQLLDLARGRNAVRFGRDARALLASFSPEDAAEAGRRKLARRRVRATDTADGGFAFSGLLYGTAAETARVALGAFTRPDVAGEHRTPEQRAADGFEQLCAAALRTDAAPTQHGARPQVLVVMDAQQLAHHEQSAGTGTARFARSGQPLTSTELGPLLDDCQLIRVVLDADRTPIEASEAVRTVPVGLWRALLVRDGGCTWPGCDAPAAWCDVAHGHTPFARNGHLAPDNAALLCRRHHRRFDNGPWRIEVRGGQVRYHRTDGTDGPAGPDGSDGPDGPDGSDEPDGPDGPDASDPEVRNRPP